MIEDVVEDVTSGFRGTVVARTEYNNGCIQFDVIPKWDKKSGVVPEGLSIDSQSLRIVKKGLRHKPFEEEEEPTGGSTRKSIKQRGY